MIPFKVYIGGIPKYGYFGSIHIKDEFRAENLNKKELNELLTVFKPVKMYMVRDSSVSFRPKKEEKAENTEINPYIIRYSGFDAHLEIIWFSKIKGKVYEIQGFIRNHNFINEFLSVTFERKNFPGGFRIINTQCFQQGNFTDYKKITWARGSEEYPNDFTLYTDNLEIDFIEFLNN